MPLPRRMYLLVVVLVALVALPVVISLPANEVSPPACSSLAASDALIRDAQSYAKDFGVDVEEALCRLMLQGEIGKLGAKLEANEKDTFAGLRIQNSPNYRVIVEFTSGGEATMAPYLEEIHFASIVEVRSADVSLEHLETAQSEAMHIADSAGIRAESGIMVQDNRVELYVTDSKQFWAALHDRSLRLPHNVRVIEVEHLSRPGSKPVGATATYTA